MVQKQPSVGVDLGPQRRKLVLIAVFFAAPVLLSTALYFLASPDKLPKGNRGTLVQPAVPLPEVHWSSVEKEGALPSLREKWSYVHFLAGRCDEVCLRSLYKTRQIHARLNKDGDRLQRVLVILGDVSADGLAEIRKRHPGLTIVRGGGENWQKWLGIFKLPAPDGSWRTRTWLVDPLGNLMMWYAPDQDPEGMLKDLNRLLKYSQIG